MMNNVKAVEDKMREKAEATALMRDKANAVGWHILVEIVAPTVTSAFGRNVDLTTGKIEGTNLFIADAAVEKQQTKEDAVAVFAKVLKVGQAAFKRFGGVDVTCNTPIAPFCSVGDYIMIPTFAGMVVPAPGNRKTNLRVLLDEEVVCAIDKSLFEQERTWIQKIIYRNPLTNRGQ